MTTARRRSRTLLAAAGTLALTAALAGCGELVVLNPGSTSTCEPDGAPVTLTTSQDASGEVLSIRYQGPDDLAVVFTHGYSLENVPEAAATGAYAFSQTRVGDSDNTAYLLRLDPATDGGWSSTSTSGMLDATFTGNIDDLIDGRATYFSTQDGTAIGEIAPVFVAVMCDSDFESGEVETLSSNPDLAPDLLLASPLNPGNVRLGPFVITSQSTVDGVTTGTLRFDADAAAVFDGFVPTRLAEAALVLDVADVPDDTFSQLWFQEFRRDATTVGTFQITSPITLTGSMNFVVTSNAAPAPLPDAAMRLRLVFANADLGGASTLDALSAARSADDVADIDLSDLAPAAAGDAKAAFFDATYNAEEGLSFGAVAAEEQPQEELADTGANDALLTMALGALALMAIGAVSALGATRRRREASPQL